MEHPIPEVCGPSRDGWLQTPVTLGLKLWWSNLGSIVVYSVKFGVVAAFFLALDRSVFYSLDEHSRHPTGTAFFVFAVTLLMGMCAICTLLSDLVKSDDQGQSSSLLQSIWRFIPWILTWIVVWTLICLGYLFFIFPGIYLGIRLFWADEFTLLHGDPPWRAIEKSWALTSQAQGIISFQFRTSLAMWIPVLGVGLPSLGIVSLAYSMLPVTYAMVVSNFFLTTAVMVMYSGFHAMELVFFYGLLEAQVD